VNDRFSLHIPPYVFLYDRACSTCESLNLLIFQYYLLFHVVLLVDLDLMLVLVDLNKIVVVVVIQKVDRLAKRRIILVEKLKEIYTTW
jgi:hypothetical protein